MSLNSNKLINTAGMISCLLHALLLISWLAKDSLQKYSTQPTNSTYQVYLYTPTQLKDKPTPLLPPLKNKPSEKTRSTTQIEPSSLPATQAISKPIAQPTEQNTKAEILDIPEQIQETETIAQVEDQAIPPELQHLLEELNDSTPQPASEAPPKANRIDELIAEYRVILQQWLASKQHYPRKARVKGYQGTALIYFSLDSSGSLGLTKLTKSSGHSLLDRAALKTLRSGKIPPPPEALVARQISFNVPVVFALD